MINHRHLFFVVFLFFYGCVETLISVTIIPDGRYHVKIESQGDERDIKDKDFNLNDAVPLTGKSGSISIHHARLLHGSAMNDSSSRRMMLFYELSAADSWPLVGAPSYMKFTSPNDLWKQMKSQLISGEISTCPRMENIPVRIPLPPPSDYGSIFKTQKTGNSKSAFM